MNKLSERLKQNIGLPSNPTQQDLLETKEILEKGEWLWAHTGEDLIERTEILRIIETMIEPKSKPKQKVETFQQLSIYDYYEMDEKETKVKIVWPLLKQGKHFVVWTWFDTAIKKFYGKFAMELTDDGWVEKKPFEEYGVLKGVDHILPNGLENILRVMERDWNITFYGYFNYFKLVINSKWLDKDTEVVGTLTTKQARIPNSGLIANDPENNWQYQLFHKGNVETFKKHLTNLKQLTKEVK